MDKDIVVDGHKFDAILKRLLDARPITKAAISAKIKAEKRTKQATRKMDTPKSSKR